jgi:hypothetical protein
MQYPEENLPKSFAIKQFIRRLRQAEEQGQVRNEQSMVGEAMFFHCKHCGVICDILPEDYFFPPHKTCSQCQGLINEGWMTEAVAGAKKYYHVDE